MAENTPLSLRQQVVYSVFVRNHTPQGTFRALIPDLPRIRDLGADVIWLMPIHPIGEKARKGSLGSPYANRDYRTVNPEYGTYEDFLALADAVHAHGMKLMIDVVYNHTSPDSVLWETHPEFFYKMPDGSPGNHMGNWTDVIDLDYTVPALWDYQIETLKSWARIVDGFRCDVASLVPVEFWLRARREIAACRPDFLWLAESVHISFNALCRRRGMYAARDIDAFAAFDMEYDYDIRETFDRYLRREVPLSVWLDMLNFQEFTYPDNYDKLRCLENHDQPRIASLVPRESDLRNYTAMLYFLKGTAMLYAGQEAACTHRPDLFERDIVNFDTGTDLSPLLRTLGRIKKETLSPEDSFWARGIDDLDIAVMTRDGGGRRKVGIFSLRSRSGQVPVELPDGVYTDALTGTPVTVTGGTVLCAGAPLVIA